MKQSQLLDPVYIRIRDNLPSELPADRLFLASENPDEQLVTVSKVVLYHEPATSQITTLGAEDLVCRRFERGGTIRIVVHTPVITNGDVLGVIIAEQIRDLFEGRQADAPLHYDNVAVRSTGRDGQASWITNVVITYRLDVVK